MSEMKIGDIMHIEYGKGTETPHIYFGTCENNVEHFVQAHFYGIPSSGPLNIIGRKQNALFSRTIHPESEEHSKLIGQLKKMGLPVK